MGVGVSVGVGVRVAVGVWVGVDVRVGGSVGVAVGTGVENKATPNPAMGLQPVTRIAPPTRKTNKNREIDRLVIAGNMECIIMGYSFSFDRWSASSFTPALGR